MIELLGERAAALDRGAHGVMIVLDDIEHRELPQRRHVEALIDLALIGRALAEEGERRREALPRYLLAKASPVPSGAGAPTMPWPPIEILLHREHVHRAALALGIAMAASGEFGHHALGVHARGEHVAVIAIGGDDLVARLDRHLHADDDRLLADIEMAEAADIAHAVELARLLLEAADEQHPPVGLEFLPRAQCRASTGGARGVAEPEICGLGR